MKFHINFLRILIFIGLAVSVNLKAAELRPIDFPFKLGDPHHPHLNVRWNEEGPVIPEVAKLKMKERADSILRLLNPTINPYSGVETTPENCQVQNLPKPIHTENSRSIQQLISLYSSENLILGSCPDSTRILKTQYLMLYCTSSHMLYYVRYFYPRQQDWYLDPAAQCKN